MSKTRNRNGCPHQLVMPSSGRFPHARSTAGLSHPTVPHGSVSGGAAASPQRGTLVELSSRRQTRIPSPQPDEQRMRSPTSGFEGDELSSTSRSLTVPPTLPVALLKRLVAVFSTGQSLLRNRSPCDDKTPGQLDFQQSPLILAPARYKPEGHVDAAGRNARPGPRRGRRPWG